MSRGGHTYISNISGFKHNYKRKDRLSFNGPMKMLHGNQHEHEYDKKYDNHRKNARNREYEKHIIVYKV